MYISVFQIIAVWDAKKFEKSLSLVLQFRKKCVPLHSLSGMTRGEMRKRSLKLWGQTTRIVRFRSFASAFGGTADERGNNKSIVLYNVEFDPGSGWTLATGLTHASRGASRAGFRSGTAATGARVSNAYPTFPFPGASPAKAGLIPGGVPGPHGCGTKGAIRKGMGVRSISLTAG